MNDDLTGQRVGSALRDHVPSTPQAPFDLAEVKGRARGIRRRRTLAGAAGAALTVGLLSGLGPTALTALQGEDETVLPPATQAPSPTPRADVRLTGDEPRGEDAVGWSDADGLRDLLGDAAPDDVWQMPQVARVGDHWVVAHRERGAMSVQLGSATGQAAQWKATEGVAAATAGTGVIAFVDRTTDELTLLGTEGDAWMERTLATVPQGAGVADVTGQDCFGGSDCRIVLSFGDGRAPLVVDGAGRVSTLDPDALTVSAARDDLVALTDPPALDANGEQAEAPCTRVLDDGVEAWSSCELGVVGFSPDGRWALVRDAYQSGWGLPRVGIADAATGELFFWIDPPGESAGVDSNGAVWEDDGHVVLSTWSWSNEEWNLFRVSLTGEVEQAADSRGGTEGDFPFFPPIH